jgi:hypothetical protein
MSAYAIGSPTLRRDRSGSDDRHIGGADHV